MKTEIKAVWDGDKKVCETTDKKEIAYFEKKGMQIIKTGSYVIEKVKR